MAPEKDLRDSNSPKSAAKKPKIVFFGHFGSDNFGNEATLQAILFNLRRRLPEAEFTGLCTNPEAAFAVHGIAASPISPPVITAWAPKGRAARLVRSLVFGIPSELYRWLQAFSTIKNTDAVIIPGTGLLTDSFGVMSWGPYSVFKWSVVAKLSGCKLLFVSVGVGPVRRPLSKRFVRWALGLADFRSYRDVSSLEYVKSIGFTANNDRVYPDLAFSLPQPVNSDDRPANGRRPVVGLGLMNLAAMYGDNAVSSEVYRDYVDSFVILVKWLLDHEFDVRLLIGELGDPVEEFRSLLDERLPGYDRNRVMDAPVDSVGELLSQFVATDFVVATRFHNVLFALLNDKPTVSISFHAKCTSLMNATGLSAYCLPIDRLTGDNLIKTTIDAEKNFDKLKSLIRERTDGFRKSLEEQYEYIVAETTEVLASK